MNSKIILSMKRFLTLSLLATLAFVSCKKDDPVKVMSITLNETAVSLEPEATKQLSVAEVLPAEAEDKTVTWSSNNEAVATVDQTGLVTVVATAADKATAIISATANDGSGVKGSCTVTVSYIKVASITLNKTTMLVKTGATGQLSVTEVLPENAADKTIAWSSNNAAVATVNAEGLVTVLATAADGATATITATAADGGGATATCVVTATIAIEINGVLWAPKNVDAVGTFASAPEAAGKYYQWNRKKAWIATSGTVDDWDTTDPTGDAWEAANSPCPTGWRLPTYAEIKLLADGTKDNRKKVTINSVACMEFTDNVNGNVLIIPIADYLNWDTGKMLVPTPGSYLNIWTSEKSTYAGFSYTGNSYNPGSGQFGQSQNKASYGYNVRCVRQ